MIYFQTESLSSIIAVWLLRFVIFENIIWLTKQWRCLRWGKWMISECNNMRGNKQFTVVKL